MKITKEEKSLYNFLNVAFAIFKESDSRNTIVGRGNKIYFFTQGYIGMFEDKDRETMVGGNYDFGKYFYDITQTPASSFLLEPIEIDDKAFDETFEQSIQLAETYLNCNSYKLEYEKSYEYKLSKIAEKTGRWLRDKDLKYLDRFKEATVFQLEDSVIVKSFGLTDEDCSNVTTMLVFVGEVHPSVDDSIQQKMDIEDEVSMLETTPTNLIESTEVEDNTIVDVDLEDTMDEDPFPQEIDENEETFEEEIIKEAEDIFDVSTEDGVFF